MELKRCHSVLIFRVLQLMNLTDSRLAQAGNEKLELAMLSFFEQFRKIYIGDQVQKSSKVRTPLMFNCMFENPIHAKHAVQIRPNQ